MHEKRNFALVLAFAAITIWSIWAWLASRQANIIMQQADPVPGAKSPR